MTQMQPILSSPRHRRPPAQGVPATRRAALFLGVLLAACSSPGPDLYTLEPSAGQTRASAPRLIELRTITLARYLERPQIVRSSEGFRLDLLGNDWWGEPLDAMLGRIMIRNLSQRLPGAMVFADTGTVLGSPDATVGINVQRLDQNRDGVVVLIAQVSVRRRTTVTRDVTITVMPQSPGTPGLVAAMSTAVGQLADHVAEMLTGRG